jgi:mRNA-degrading endonuclease toxin of MazEF toxin-antitoxin module
MMPVLPSKREATNPRGQPLDACSSLESDHAPTTASGASLSPQAGFAELEADSVANVTQLAAIDRATLDERVTMLPDWLMAQVDAGLRRALALTPSK